MAPQTSRRTLMTGLAAAFTLAPAGAALAAPSTTARAASSDSAPPTIRAVPVTPTVSAVTVDAGDRGDLTVAVVTDGAGTTLGRAVLTVAGTAVIPVPVPTGSRRRVRVTVGSAGRAGSAMVRTLELDTSAAAVRSSLWRVVNKRTAMARTEQPARLVKVAGVEMDVRVADALKALLGEGSKRRLQIYPSNGFRSYDWQSGLYQSYVKADGVEKADTYSARPGFSEHQTGLAFDAKSRDEKCSLQECFGATPAGKFLTTEAGRFGFLVRYTKENRDTTGYQPEPWHLRFVGPWLVQHLQASGRRSLEDVFALPAAPDYA